MTERKEKHKQKLKERGITLIALVITIIVLLILAGVALATLTGDSGILNNAENAKNQTNIANAKEQVALAVQGARIEGIGTITRDKLQAELDSVVGTGKYELSEGTESWTVKVGDYEATVSKNGSVIGPRDTKTLPSAEGTTPWLPTGFSQVAGTNLDNGLTITNEAGTQNYVWIEVPTTIEQSITLSNGTTKTVKLANAASDEEISLILQAYARNYTDSTALKDEWYDLYRATWDGKSEFAYIPNRSSNYFTEWKSYYGENNVYYSNTSSVTGTMTQVNFESDSYSYSNYYFIKVNDNFKNHTDGCGMTYSQYQTSYSNMLKSVKTYGGFWFAQYEAGIAYEKNGETATNRTSHSEIKVTRANYAKDQYVYNHVYCSEAQKIANADTTNQYISSLPFGIQWDLVSIFLDVKTDLEYSDFTSNSTWGNYYDILYTPSTTAKYSTDFGVSYISVVNNGVTYSKTSSDDVLLTTGAIESTTVSADASPMNIYDFAGNVSEWTLSTATGKGGYYCGQRDWYYGNRGGAAHFVSDWCPRDPWSAIDYIGFRSVLY